MDWKNMIRELMESGVTQLQMAARLQVSQGTISDLYTGRTATPNWTTGEALRKLHQETILGATPPEEPVKRPKKGERAAASDSIYTERQKATCERIERAISGERRGSGPGNRRGER